MPADNSHKTGTAAAPEANLTLHLGRADDLRAEVFLTIAPPQAIPSGSRLTLHATLTGPESTRATTLPVRLPIKTVSEQTALGMPQVIGKVILTEPAYWTPEVPMLYRVRGDLLCGAEPIACLDTTVGVRRFGVRGHSLWLEGRRWVVRGGNDIESESKPERQRETARGSALARVIDLRPDGFAAQFPTAAAWHQCLEEADQNGRPLLICIAPNTSMALAQSTIMALTRHPAVIMAILPEDLVAEAAACKPPAGTLLLATQIAASKPPAEAHPGIDVHLVNLSAEAMPADEWRQPLGPPAIAWSVSGQPDRTGCNQLQARLARWRLTGEGPPATWDWAGFLIGGQLVH